MKPIGITLCIVLLLGVGVPPVFSQGNARPMLISEIVGDTLDRLERDIYGLLPEIEHFLWAVFTLNPDSSVAAHIKREAHGADAFLLRPNYAGIRSFRESIDRIEVELQDPTRSGRDVVVTLADSGLAEGELVYAVEGGILVSSQYWDFPAEERFIVRDSIRTVSVEGESFILSGIGIGLLTGGGIGAILGGSGGGWLAGTAALYGAGVFGGIGIIIGAIVGAAGSTSQMAFVISDPDALSALRPYAKFPLQKFGLPGRPGTSPN